jgi:hypothetical protein
MKTEKLTFKYSHKGNWIKEKGIWEKREKNQIIRSGKSACAWHSHKNL